MALGACHSLRRSLVFIYACRRSCVMNPDSLVLLPDINQIQLYNNDATPLCNINLASGVNVVHLGRLDSRIRANQVISPTTTQITLCLLEPRIVPRDRRVSVDHKLRMARHSLRGSSAAVNTNRVVWLAMGVANQK